jgi:hypothetical protein
MSVLRAWLPHLFILLGVMLSGCGTLSFGQPPFQQAYCSVADPKLPPCGKPSPENNTPTNSAANNNTAASTSYVCPDKMQVLYQTGTPKNNSGDGPQSAGNDPPPAGNGQQTGDTGSTPAGGGQKSPGSASASTGAQNWTLCEQLIIASAIQHCVSSAGNTDLLYQILTGLQDASNIGGGAASATAAIVGGLTKTPPLWIAGAVTASTNVAAAFKTLISGTPPAPTPSSMITAASSYASLYQNTQISSPNANSYLFYAGLWNAAGSACPPNLLLGSFQMERIKLSDLAQQALALQRASPVTPPATTGNKAASGAGS